MDNGIIVAIISGVFSIIGILLTYFLVERKKIKLDQEKMVKASRPVKDEKPDESNTLNDRTIKAELNGNKVEPGDEEINIRPGDKIEFFAYPEADVSNIIYTALYPNGADGGFQRTRNYLCFPIDDKAKPGQVLILKVNALYNDGTFCWQDKDNDQASNFKYIFRVKN